MSQNCDTYSSELNGPGNLISTSLGVFGNFSAKKERFSPKLHFGLSASSMNMVKLIESSFCPGYVTNLWHVLLKAQASWGCVVYIIRFVLSIPLVGSNSFLSKSILVLLASVATCKQILVSGSDQSKKRQIGCFDLTGSFSSYKLICFVKNIQKHIVCDRFATIYLWFHW